MRLDKVATRILLILSVVHVAASAPAIIRQKSVEVTKDVATALERRANSDDESSHPLPRMDNGLPPASGTLPSQDDTSPAPGDPELHSDPPTELGTPQLHIDQPPMPGAPPSQHDPVSASGTPQLHNDQPPTPGASPSQDDMSSALEDSQLPVHDDPSSWWSHTNWRPPEEMLQGESSGTAEIPLHDDLLRQHADWHPLEETLQSEPSVVPQLHEDPWWHNLDWALPASPAATLHEGSSGTSSITWGAPESQNNPPSEPGTSQLHDDGSSSYREHIDFGAIAGASSLSDFDSDASMSLDSDASMPVDSDSSMPVDSDASMPVDSPPALGSSQVHDNLSPALGTLQFHDDESEEFDSSYRWHNDFRVMEGASSSSDLDSEAPLLEAEPQPLESAPEADTFSDGALGRKLRDYVGVGAVGGILVGTVVAIEMLNNDHSHGLYVSAFFHPSLTNI